MMNRRAFSLIELLIVIGLIAGLTALAAPTVLQLFQGRAISQAFNTLSGAFQEARSKAITTGRSSAVFMSFRSHESNPIVKVWVLEGGDNDLDEEGPLKGLAVDESELIANVDYDDRIIASYEFPATIFLHGLASNIMQSDSGAGGDHGYFTRWYCVFKPDGLAMMIKPDGDVGQDGSASGWESANDYLPTGYDFEGTAVPIADENVTIFKTSPVDFEDEDYAHLRYDLKLRDETDELYIYLQPSTGKLIKSSFND